MPTAHLLVAMETKKALEIEKILRKLSPQKSYTLWDSYFVEIFVTLVFTGYYVFGLVAMAT